jgi:hypothetical protein
MKCAFVVLLAAVVLAPAIAAEPKVRRYTEDERREFAKTYLDKGRRLMQEARRQLAADAEQARWPLSDASMAFDYSLHFDPSNVAAFLQLAQANRLYNERFSLRARQFDSAERFSAWLATNQLSDGGWSFANGSTKAGPFQNPGARKSRTAATSLSLLVMLGTGQTHRKGQWMNEVQRAVYFLASYGKTSGDTLDLRGPDGDMVSHALATLVVCSLVGETQDSVLRAPAQAAVRFIETSQHEDGGWNLEPCKPGDMVVSGWHFLALRSARKAKLSVSEERLRLLEKFVSHAQHESGTSFGRTGPGNDPTATAVGLLCRQLRGADPKDPNMTRAVEELAKRGVQKHDVLFNFFATQVMHHHMGKPWINWNKSLRDQVVSAQTAAGPDVGSWFDPQDPSAPVGGRLYHTALNAMSLEVYYRYLSIYGAFNPESDMQAK